MSLHGETVHLVSDHMAFPLVVVDQATGDVLWESEAEPFGEIVQWLGDYDPLLRYPGQWVDPTNWW